MPFSFAHPLAVVPLARTALPFSALVVGSMSPDFHYLIHLSQSSHSTHTLGALFSFCLPASLIVLTLWHWLFKRPLLELLPDRHQQALRPISSHFTFGPPKRFLMICLAVLIGAATHVIWDSFTHLWGWPVQKLSFLQAIAISTSFQDFPVYKLLQYACSIIGTALVMFLYWRWERIQTSDTPFAPRYSGTTRLKITGTLLLVASITAVLWAFRLFPPTDSFHNFKAFVVRGIIIGTAILGLEMFLYSLWFWFWFSSGRTTDPADSTPSD